MQWFDDEIKLGLADGVTEKENLPFLLKPTYPVKKAIILIHGFSSSPREMLTLGREIVKHNFTVYGVRLPGHGTSPQDLAGRKSEEWLAACKRGYLGLVQSGFSVSAGGLSTGALLTMKLALRYPLEKQILLAPFLKLQHPLAAAAQMLSVFVPYQKKELQPDERPYYYSLRPLKGIAQINRLRWQLARELDKITIPSLVLASKGDKTIAEGTAEDLYDRLGSQKKTFHLYGKTVPHVLTSEQNPELQDVLKRCCDFLAFVKESGSPT